AGRRRVPPTVPSSRGSRLRREWRPADPIAAPPWVRAAKCRDRWYQDAGIVRARPSWSTLLRRRLFALRQCRLERKVHVELCQPATADVARLDLDELRRVGGVFDDLRRLQIAHEHRHARTRLRIAGHIDTKAFLLERGEIDAVGRLVDQLL